MNQDRVGRALLLYLLLDLRLLIKSALAGFPVGYMVRGFLVGYKRRVVY